MEPKNSLKTLRNVLRLVETYKLDSIEFNGIKVTKSKHAPDAAQVKAAKAEADRQVKSRIPGFPTTVEELDREAAEIAGIRMDN